MNPWNEGGIKCVDGYQANTQITLKQCKSVSGDIAVWGQGGSERAKKKKRE